MTSVILWTGDLWFKLVFRDSLARTSRKTISMSNSKPNAAVGTDWTGLLADPDLARNLGKLLQTYRDAPPERREEALLSAMREIKQAASSGTATSASTKVEAESSPPPVPTPV